MPQLPFEIPKSLVSYADQFDSDPLKATARLKKQLKKRGPDAIGCFLLAWFYHLRGKNTEAMEQAMKAKVYAPGSPFFEKLHYFLAHPDRFEAWTPDIRPSSLGANNKTVPRPGPILDLDALIEKLSRVESERIRLSGDVPDTDVDGGTGTVAEVADDPDDIASETLANIHETQGKTEAAINTYKRLKKINRDKKDFYKEQIVRLKKLRDQKKGN